MKNGQLTTDNEPRAAELRIEGWGVVFIILCLVMMFGWGVFLGWVLDQLLLMFHI